MTLSIIARCSKTGDLGACVATVNMAVGNRVPHVISNVGAICTQAYTELSYGINGLKLLELGFSPTTALEALQKEDQEFESRQIAIIDACGRIAAFTGKECSERKGHLIGDCYIILGNKLDRISVLEDVEIGFTQSNGNLGNRLLSALEASETEARERKTSAALLVAKRKQPMTPFSIQLRVDFHVDPIKQLRIIYDEYMHTYSCE